MSNFSIRKNRPLLYVVIPGFMLIAIGVFFGSLGFRINLTPSMPLGIWRQVDHLEKGMPATFCLPKTEAGVNRMIVERQYLPVGECANGFAPLLKYVAATPGDIVDIDMNVVKVNGRPIPNSATLVRDREGRSMAFIPRGRYAVGHSEYWFIAIDRKNSLDSRYFGAIPAAFVLHAMKPVVTFSLYPSLTRRVF